MSETESCCGEMAVDWKNTSCFGLMICLDELLNGSLEFVDRGFVNLKQTILDVTNILLPKVQKLLKTSRSVFASELFEAEIEFPLSIFTLKECKSNSLSLSTAASIA